MTRKRQYTFKAPDETKCQIFVHNLRQLRERHRAGQERAPQLTTIEVSSQRKKNWLGF